MTAIETIARKRDRQELSDADIAAIVNGFVRGDVSEPQMAAFLMAVALNGMSATESASLTLAMAGSGERLDLSGVPGIKVDKHSTGGVGDKTTLVVAPVVAALGVPVPKMSGRALGHTGGTIDKLEVIPGLATGLSPERFRAQLAEIGLVIAAQSSRMVPADERIYALRDATATVESIPLIASSIMSKKLAVGADAVVLDVKTGAGAFMQEAGQARELARLMVEIGARAGKRMAALVTRMDQPLGAAVGDAAELSEAISTLGGRGPADLVELCECLAGHMLALGAGAPDPMEGSKMARRCLASGVGLAKLRQMVVAQGGSPECVDDPAMLTEEAERIPVGLDGGGVLVEVDARRIGAAVRDLKAGAETGQGLCGVMLERKVGDRVGGEPVAWVLAPAHARTAAHAAAQQVQAAFRLGASAPPAAALVAESVTS